MKKSCSAPVPLQCTNLSMGETCGICGSEDAQRGFNVKTKSGVVPACMNCFRLERRAKLARKFASEENAVRTSAASSETSPRSSESSESSTSSSKSRIKFESRISNLLERPSTHKALLILEPEEEQQKRQLFRHTVRAVGALGNIHSLYEFAVNSTVDRVESFNLLFRQDDAETTMLVQLCGEALEEELHRLIEGEASSCTEPVLAACVNLLSRGSSRPASEEDFEKAIRWQFQFLMKLSAILGKKSGLTRLFQTITRAASRKFPEKMSTSPHAAVVGLLWLNVLCPKLVSFGMQSSQTPRPAEATHDRKNRYSPFHLAGRLLLKLVLSQTFPDSSSMAGFNDAFLRSDAAKGIISAIMSEICGSTTEDCTVTTSDEILGKKLAAKYSHTDAKSVVQHLRRVSATLPQVEADLKELNLHSSNAAFARVGSIRLKRGNSVRSILKNGRAHSNDNPPSSSSSSSRSKGSSSRRNSDLDLLDQVSQAMRSRSTKMRQRDKPHHPRKPLVLPVDGKKNSTRFTLGAHSLSTKSMEAYKARARARYDNDGSDDDVKEGLSHGSSTKSSSSSHRHRPRGQSPLSSSTATTSQEDVFSAQTDEANDCTRPRGDSTFAPIPGAKFVSAVGIENLFGTSSISSATDDTGSTAPYSPNPLKPEETLAVLAQSRRKSKLDWLLGKEWVEQSPSGDKEENRAEGKATREAVVVSKQVEEEEEEEEKMVLQERSSQSGSTTPERQCSSRKGDVEPSSPTNKGAQATNPVDSKDLDPKEHESWTIDEVQAWLSTIKLPEGRSDLVMQIFISNDIDGQELMELGDAELREMGIASMGLRRKLSRAIAALTSSTCDGGDVEE